MQITPLTETSLTLTTDTILLDRGKVEASDIHVAAGVHLRYVFLGDKDGTCVREFHLSAHSQLDGGAVIYAMDTTYRATTYIEGDGITSHLQILGLARASARLDIRGGSIVDMPYRHIDTRVDQNNIFLGE